GAGVAVGLGGGALQWRARSNYDNYDERVAEQCPDGCGDPAQLSELDDLERTASRQNTASGVMLAIGGAAVVAGLTLLVANQPRVAQERAFKFDVKPMVGARAAGLSARGSF
ncbi:MAG: hypothetical protein AAGC55_19225, partial [Myxococcota bacterium]